jgi:hypothetical protein
VHLHLLPTHDRYLLQFTSDPVVFGAMNDVAWLRYVFPRLVPITVALAKAPVLESREGRSWGTHNLIAD